MEKHYSPKDIEQKWYQNWEDNHYFAPSGEGNPYCIMIPPPNVTGTLHMGHAFQDTIMDTLIRYHRMSGRDTLWQAGTDHAGIATQMVVERQLESEGKTRHDLGRAGFIKRVWDWKNHSGGTISKQLRRMGASVDWSRERFTMDDGLSDAVKEVFVKLHDEGLIYRGKRLVNWDPVLLTALSDLEVIAEEEDGFMYHIRYPFVDEDGFMEIATTRPETMLADGALAVNPADERFTSMVGKQVQVPMTTRIIPIVSDGYVDQAFGTGCVKITPAHDFNDWEVGKRHEMEVINLFTPSAMMNDNAPSAYQGLDRFDARKQIVQDLDTAGLLIKIEPHKMKPPRGDRTGAVVEPYLTDQWYVKMTDLAEPAIKAVENGQIKFVPDNWKNTYYRWLEDIQDWCISRQIWWGHQIPAWYDTDGNCFVGRNETDVRAKYQIASDVILKQDEDVLDTWFSSALWPYSTLGWPDNTAEIARYYPTSVLVTGFDIIFFWVARMIMFGLKFMDEVPFHEVYIHGLVRDAHGQKMSKSKGNVLDPIDLIDGISLDALLEKRGQGLMQPKMKAQILKQTKKDFPDGIPAFGTDALRFTYASLATTGRDINFNLSRVEGYRNFCNKIWNATRFVLMQVKDQTIQNNVDALEFSPPDLWIASRLQTTKANIAKSMATYRLDLVAHSLYEFIWNDYCDWYVELAKITLQSDAMSEAQKDACRYQLIHVLETTMRLVHPIMPYISEEIWQKIMPMLGGSEGDSIMTKAYPVADDAKRDMDAEAKIEWLQSFVLGVRKIRGEMNIPPNKSLPVLLQSINRPNFLSELSPWIMSLTKIDSMDEIDKNAEIPDAAIALVDTMKILIPLEGLINKEDEIVRINKELDKLSKNITRIKGKLSNVNFIDKAPDEVVQKEQEKMQQLTDKLTKMEEQREVLSS